MPKYHNCEQYSDEWDNLRIGIPTSSGFENIITPLGKPTTEKRFTDYAHGIIAEKILKRRMETFMSQWMELGRMMELDAIGQYELMRDDVECKKIGFVTDDKATMGCSPDRLVGNNGLLEIKCPKPNTLIRYIINEDVADDYKPQLQGQLYITQREWVDIYAYHPEITARVFRVYRDEKYIATLADYIDKLNEYIEKSIFKIANQTERTKA